MKNLIKVFFVLFLIVIIGMSEANSVNALGINATIKVGMFPEGVAYDSSMGEIFVANWLSNSVSIISDTTNFVLENVTVGSAPSDVTYDSGKGEIFIANWNSNSASVISDKTNTVVAFPWEDLHVT